MAVVLLKNNIVLTILLLCFCNLKLTTQTSANSTHYIAGVVEFKPTQFSQPNWTSIEKLRDNLQGYIQILTSKEAAETDILVFPEMTLNDNEEATFVPDPAKLSEAPCDSAKTSSISAQKYHDFFIELSCQAKNLGKYIVINVVEKDYCLSPQADPRPCASSGLNLFNTNVVFDRKGVVISRYRKVHLWGEPRNTTFVPSYDYFDTDFGVRFGHFVCFDLMFYMPAQEMVDKVGITDFIFPTMWFSQLPFLSAVQMQSAWSYANDVNFLAAGASFPSVGTTGTGIFAGRRGTLDAIMSRKDGQRRLLVAAVKKIAPKRRRRDFKQIIERARQQRTDDDDLFIKQDYLENYETVQVNLSDGHSFERQLCQHNLKTFTQFCCHFKLNWTEIPSDSLQQPHYNYRLGVFNGLRKEVAPETNFLRNCALFACTGSTIKDCGKVFHNVKSPNVIINHLVIEAKFPNAHELLIMPNSLKEDLLPVAVDDFNWTETYESSSRKVRLELLKPVSNLLTFSIYGNYYDSHNVVDEPILCDNNEIDAASVFCDGRGDDGATTSLISGMLFLLCIVVSSNRLL